MKVVIERLGINGEGVAKGTDGEQLNKVCFVPFAITGEQVEISVVSEKKSFCNCKLDEIITKSDNRVTPPCKYFGKCGGCDLQHIDKDFQMEFKRDKVKDTITKYAKIDCDIEPTIRLNDFAYRNKMVFPFCSVDGILTLGMFQHNTHKVVNIEKCLLCKDIINQVLLRSREYFSSSNLRGYDFKRKSGELKYLVVRVHKENILVTIVATKRLNLNNYYEYIRKYFDNIGVSIIISNSDDDIMSGEYEQIAGVDCLEIEEFSIRYKVDNRGFLQVNNEIKTKLYNSVLDEISEHDNVIDAYSGAGLLSAIMAKKCNKVIAIEINASASNSAKKLAKDNNIMNLECITGDVKDNIGQVLDALDECVVVLDPARSGCDNSIIRCLTDESNVKKINKIIYVSCNPATLSRDLFGLKDWYSVMKVIPLDMFPQTKHVETLVVLKMK